MNLKDQTKRESENHLVCIGIGSNIEPRKNIPIAVNLLQRYGSVVSTSKAWETPAVGSKGPDFLNAAILLGTNLNPKDLKDQILCSIESQLGRIRTANKYAPRTIDLDLLIYDDEILDPDLWTLAHIAVPVSEIMPELKNLKTGETISQVADKLISENPIHIRCYDLFEEC